MLPVACIADYEQNMCSVLYPPFGEKEKKHTWIFMNALMKVCAVFIGLVPTPKPR